MRIHFGSSGPPSTPLENTQKGRILIILFVIFVPKKLCRWHNIVFMKERFLMNVYEYTSILTGHQRCPELYLPTCSRLCSPYGSIVSQSRSPTRLSRRRSLSFLINQRSTVLNAQVVFLCTYLTILPRTGNFQVSSLEQNNPRSARPIPRSRILDILYQRWFTPQPLRAFTLHPRCSARIVAWQPGWTACALWRTGASNCPSRPGGVNDRPTRLVT